jgi:acyl-CoA thioesterase I
MTIQKIAPPSGILHQSSICSAGIENCSPSPLPSPPGRGRLNRFVLAAALLALFTGCATRAKSRVDRRVGESVVLIGEKPAFLANMPLREKPLSVRSTYPSGTNTSLFLPGKDFVVDYSAGSIQRTSGSRIPDFSTNVLFGKEQFDHSQFPGYGNGPFFVFVDYSFRATNRWPIQNVQTQFLQKTQAKLESGKSLKIVAFGDSITAGGEATTPALIFWQRWADYLQHKYPQAQVTAINGATGGDTTIQGLQRLKAKVLDQKPDLVLIGFGMNDHNIGGLTIPQFEKNLTDMIERIRNETGSEVVLFSTFPPNPKWKFGSHHMRDYARATSAVAERNQCAYADVFNNWESIANRKKPEDLLGNNINHPNDFGHWIYFRVFEELGL